MRYRLVLLALLCTVTACAQESAPMQELPPIRTETLKVTSQLVLLDASVTDKKTGKVIAGLTPDDFAIAEDGVPQHISSLSQAHLPLSIVFLFDATDTVKPVLWPLAVGARRVLNQLHENDEVEVASFSTHVTVVQKFTTDHARIVFALGDASGIYDKERATFIYEDLYEATELAQAATVHDSRRVEVWLTDGTANYEAADIRSNYGKGAPAVLHTQAEAANLLGRSGVVVSALVQRSDLTEHQHNDPNSRFGDIEHFADVTGGPVQYTTATEIVDKFGALLDSLRQRYTLAYKPGQVKPAGTVCKLQLTLSPAFLANHPEIRAKDVVIRTRQSYTR
ncbi:MAG TPA: VWA domain-containing protein [Acidobacteriaceae bacterium]|jgi:VWFA-related protein